MRGRCGRHDLQAVERWELGQKGYLGWWTFSFLFKFVKRHGNGSLFVSPRGRFRVSPSLLGIPAYHLLVVLLLQVKVVAALLDRIGARAVGRGCPVMRYPLPTQRIQAASGQVVVFNVMQCRRGIVSSFQGFGFALVVVMAAQISLTQRKVKAAVTSNLFCSTRSRWQAQAGFVSAHIT